MKKPCHKADSSTSRGGWEGRFLLLRLSPHHHHVHTRDKKTQAGLGAAAHRNTKTQRGPRTRSSTRRKITSWDQDGGSRTVSHLILLLALKKKSAEGVVHERQRSDYRDPDFFKFFQGKWGEGRATFLLLR